MYNDLACTYPTATIEIPIIRNTSPVIRTPSVLDVDCGCWDGTGRTPFVDCGCCDSSISFEVVLAID